MSHKKVLHDAWKGLLENPSMLGVLVLELILLILVGIGFIMIGVSNQPSGNASAFLLLLQFLIFILVDAYFKAGFFGMAKNTLQDGSTSIREFFPNAKRYWQPIFGFYVIRLVIVIILAIPLMYAATVRPDLILWALIFFVLGIVIVNGFWFLWAPADIILKNHGFVDAIKTSSKKANKTVKHTVRTAAISIVVIVAAYFITTGMMSSLEFFEPSPTLFYVGLVFELITYVVFAAATVVVTLYVFRNYKKR